MAGTACSGQVSIDTIAGQGGPSSLTDPRMERCSAQNKRDEQREHEIEAVSEK
jgi:hypothetical protein